MSPIRSDFNASSAVPGTYYMVSKFWRKMERNRGRESHRGKLCLYLFDFRATLAEETGFLDLVDESTVNSLPFEVFGDLSLQKNLDEVSYEKMS